VKVKEWVDGKLILDGDLLKGAEEAFREGRYIEAFSILQASLDAFMTFIYQMSEGRYMWQTHGIHHEKKYTFPILRDYMRDHGILIPKEVGELNKFYDMRNKIVHQLVMYAFQPYERYAVIPSEATEGFERGKELYQLLSSKTVEVGSEITRSSH